MGRAQLTAQHHATDTESTNRQSKSPLAINPANCPSCGTRTASRSAPFNTAQTRMSSHAAIALSAIADIAQNLALSRASGIVSHSTPYTSAPEPKSRKITRKSARQIHEGIGLCSPSPPQTPPICVFCDLRIREDSVHRLTGRTSPSISSTLFQTDRKRRNVEHPSSYPAPPVSRLARVPRTGGYAAQMRLARRRNGSSTPDEAASGRIGTAPPRAGPWRPASDLGSEAGIERARAVFLASWNGDLNVVNPARVSLDSRRSHDVVTSVAQRARRRSVRPAIAAIDTRLYREWTGSFAPCRAGGFAGTTGLLIHSGEVCLVEKYDGGTCDSI